MTPEQQKLLTRICKAGRKNSAYNTWVQSIRQTAKLPVQIEPATGYTIPFYARAITRHFVYLDSYKLFNEQELYDIMTANLLASIGRSDDIELAKLDRQEITDSYLCLKLEE